MNNELVEQIDDSVQPIQLKSFDCLLPVHDIIQKSTELLRFICTIITPIITT